jgi:transposase InsO family protein
MIRSELIRLAEQHNLSPIVLERQSIAPDSMTRHRALIDMRVRTMSEFLDVVRLTEGIVRQQGLGGLVRDAMTKAGVSRTFVYRLWSLLCRWGFSARSLVPALHRCGAPGQRRPCDPAHDGVAGRRKAGRKTNKERLQLANGAHVEPAQPGMSSIWAASVRAADKRIPAPKPPWPQRAAMIVSSAFCGRAREADGTLTYVMPEQGEYPSIQQIKRVLTFEKTTLERLQERTTKRHFTANMRGLKARNWRDVSGPGHTWVIDSTVGDIYLRSSIDRSWIVGRPVVYVIVDVWSTAVVGFYVCLSGPRWADAKVALFNSAASPNLIGQLWGYEPMQELQPLPTLPYALQCDRGEYLSAGHRQTALKLLPATSYTPPYRGDLKGIGEVLHRIEKDANFSFVPGAIDQRRAELEFRRVDPRKCVLTVREFVHVLHEVFTEYNLCADRGHRLDAYMVAAAVAPSPAGLWRFGHEVGVGYRRAVGEWDLVEDLLPHGTARVRRDGVRFAGSYYSSALSDALMWTDNARNLGGWDLSIHHYPGCMDRIWAKDPSGSELCALELSDQGRIPPGITVEEWADIEVLKTLKAAETHHDRMARAIASQERRRAIIAAAKGLTAAALDRSQGPIPTMQEARMLETAVAVPQPVPEPVAARYVQDESTEEHAELMSAILAMANAED